MVRVVDVFGESGAGLLVKPLQANQMWFLEKILTYYSEAQALWFQSRGTK